MSWGGYGMGGGWAPYVSVGEKKRQAVKYAAALCKTQKRQPDPVTIAGRKISKTFWGTAWCDNLTSYRDFSNRLPRGATYVRNGSVVDLKISPLCIEAIVAGSDPYQVRIDIQACKASRWKAICQDCSASIDSLLDLLSGKLSSGVMKRLTDTKDGLFPAPAEIRMRCSCPDASSFCKHLAAVMYGIGARLDTQPELLFVLRGVDQNELVSRAIAADNLERELASGDSSPGLNASDLGDIFGITLDVAADPAPKARRGTAKNKPPASDKKAKRPPAKAASKSKSRATSQPKVTAEPQSGAEPQGNSPQANGTSKRTATRKKLARTTTSSTVASVATAKKYRLKASAKAKASVRKKTAGRS